MNEKPRNIIIKRQCVAMAAAVAEASPALPPQEEEKGASLSYRPQLSVSCELQRGTFYTYALTNSYILWASLQNVLCENTIIYGNQGGAPSSSVR